MMSGVAWAQSSLPLSVAQANSVFEEAVRMSAQDAGSLWGVSLYGPMLIVDRETRRAAANESVSFFRAEDDVFVGVLPDSVGIANTAVDWNGRRWTMLMWPLPDDSIARKSLVAHELWHRIQGDLGLPSGSAPNLHLGTRDGRVWMQLEWRALKAALRGSGDERLPTVRDALTFRQRRHSIFPDAEREERVLLMHEGLAEYTGYALAGEAHEACRERAADALERAAGAATFVRTFAYPTGAAYGLLLDEHAPAWREGLSSQDDMVELLGRAVGFDPAEVAEDDLARVAGRYGGQALMAAEDRLEMRRKERLEDQRRRYVHGPTLTLGFIRMNVQFDPGGVDALDDIGSVYASMRLTDVWGTLTVTQGALIPSDWGSVIVPAPIDTAGGRVEGDGYALDLAEGWNLVPGEREGDYRVARVEE